MDIVESAPDLVMANIDKGIELKFLAGNESSSYVTLVAGNHVPLPNGDAGYAEIMQHLAGVSDRRPRHRQHGLPGRCADARGCRAVGGRRGFRRQPAARQRRFPAWQAEAVDAQMTFAPVPELLENPWRRAPRAGSCRRRPTGRCSSGGLFSGWVTSAAFLERDAARAEAFIAAQRDAIDWIRDPSNHEKMVGLARAGLRPSPPLSETENRQVLDSMVRNYRRYWGYEISPAAIELWNDYAQRFELIGERVAFADIVHDAAPVCTDLC